MKEKLIILLLVLSACSTTKHGYEFRIKTKTYKEKSYFTLGEAQQRIKSLPLKEDVLSRVYCYYEDEEVTMLI